MTPWPPQVRQAVLQSSSPALISRPWLALRVGPGLPVVRGVLERAQPGDVSTGPSGVGCDMGTILHKNRNRVKVHAHLFFTKPVRAA